ncbi:hypothetical protein F2P81_023769 [Scophthalmus maximus]|uniref:Consortin C-terminal domain-containing protein n=1 Tax=Scophthalmus maximus TaxID=52904 RepID=A0A6A4RS69_SCOMX|nr:hypothetical protein F2P81_023769 [Scophthalmus maximus]
MTEGAERGPGSSCGRRDVDVQKQELWGRRPAEVFLIKEEFDVVLLRAQKEPTATAHNRVSEKLLENIYLEEKIVEVTEVMGNKNTGLPKGTDTGLTQKEEGMFMESTTVNNPKTSHVDGEEEQNVNSGSAPSAAQISCQEEGGEEEQGEEKMCDEGQEVEKEEELCESSSPDGLVSILKRRRASLDGLPPPSNTETKLNSQRKVRFSEPEDGIEQDEVGGDSCLILLLLCLVTVVISIGGTALYCTLVDTYSNICTDFTQNANFYVANARRFFDGLSLWLPQRT